MRRRGGKTVMKIFMRKHVLAVLGSAVIQKASVLLLTILTARMIGATEFGKFAIIYATCVNLTAFLGEGLAATMNRYVPLAAKESDAAAHEVAGMILSFAVPLAVILALAMFLAAPLMHTMLGVKTDLTNYFRLSSLIVLFLLPGTVLAALLNTFGKHKAAAVASIGGASAIFCLALAGAALGGSFGMCAGFSAGTLLSTLAYCWMMRRHFPQPLLRLEYFRKFIKSDIVPAFALPTMATMALGGPVHWICISLLAASATGLHDVAVFTAFFQWYSIFIFIPAALTNFTVPLLVKAAHAGHFRKYSLYAIAANVGVGGFFLILILCFYPRILGLYGADFKGDANALLLLAICGFFASLIAVMNQISWAAGKTWGNLMAACIHACSYVTASLVFIKIMGFGVAGLAAAILLASILQGTIQAWLARR